jgi:hypothetical protein
MPMPARAMVISKAKALINAKVSLQKDRSPKQLASPDHYNDSRRVPGTVVACRVYHEPQPGARFSLGIMVASWGAHS